MTKHFIGFDIYKKKVTLPAMLTDNAVSNWKRFAEVFKLKTKVTFLWWSFHQRFHQF